MSYSYIPGQPPIPMSANLEGLGSSAARPGIDERGLCRHTLRKTFVTERIKAGANPEKVAALIADNPATMRKHYSVLLTNDLRATANLY